MAFFTKKLWKDRKSEYPNRRKQTSVYGRPNTYDISRDEGLVSEEGTPLNAASFNDLEGRVETAFNGVNNSLNGKATSNQVQQAQNTANAAMPKTGGWFTGKVGASTQSREIDFHNGELVNVSIRDSGGSAATSKQLVFVRQ